MRRRLLLEKEKVHFVFVLSLVLERFMTPNSRQILMSLLEIDSVPVGEFPESGGGMHVQPKCEERHKQSLAKCVETREECSDDNVVFLERKPGSNSIEMILSSMIRTTEQGNNDVDALMTKVRATENRVDGKGSLTDEKRSKVETTRPQPEEKPEKKSVEKVEKPEKKPVEKEEKPSSENEISSSDENQDESESDETVQDEETTDDEASTNVEPEESEDEDTEIASSDEENSELQESSSEESSNDEGSVDMSVDSGDENAELASLDTSSNDGSDELTQATSSDENSEVASFAMPTNDGDTSMSTVSEME